MTDAQAVIIGGGVMGVSLLYHLSKQGWKDIVLIEKNDLTHGSTWHAAGLCTHFSHSPTIQELRARSVRLYRDILPDETGQTCGFHSSGAMRITRSQDRMDEFAHVAGLSDFTGYPLEILTPDRIAELHPLANLDDLLGGIFEPDDGHVDPTMATNAMAQMAVQNGALIQRYNPVLAIHQENKNWIVETAKGTIKTKHLVNAAGTWGWEIGQMMGLDIPCVPVLHQYLVTDTISEVSTRIAEGMGELPMIRDPEESWYVRQERDGLILGPYEKEAQVWSVDGVPANFGAELLPPDLDRVEHIIEAAMTRIPALANGGIKSIVNGPITFTPDANPLIGPAHNLENAWLLTGSSMGVMEGGGAGWFLAQWMTHRAPPMDALAIDSRRFGKWADRDYRIEKAVECFGLQFGVHYPYEERPAGRSKRLSPLHDLMLERGAVMGAAYGWERPNWFSSKTGDVAIESFRRPNWFNHVASEINTVSNKVSLADLSVFSKFEVTGPDTQRFMETLGSNRPPRTGHIGLTHVLTPAGGVHSEFSVAMLDNERAYLTSAAAAEEIDFDALNSHGRNYDVSVANKTEELSVIGLMGPMARQVLAKVTNANLNEDFAWLTARNIEITGIRIWALRVSYLGELGWELHVQSKDAVTVFLALEHAGKEYEIGLYGAYAANSMRLEKGYRAWGSDLTSERTPLESGLNYLVKSDDRNYQGRVRMHERDRSGDAWDMILLEIETGEVDPFYSHKLMRGDDVVGIITSGAYGHRTRKTLALGYLREPTVRDNLSVVILGKRRAANILETPPFDPENLRLKS